MLEPAGSEPRLLTVVVHDVAPPTLPACRRLLDALSEVAEAGGRKRLPITWLAVPRYHGSASERASERWLDAAVARGDEVALHGFTHYDGGVARGLVDHLRRSHYTAGEGEFCALPQAEAARRLAAGRRWFAAHDWPLDGFVAPAWLMSPGTREALREQGFRYTSTLTRLIDVPTQRALFAPSVVYSTRAAWRRGLSIAWNGILARSHRDTPLLRFELHPADVDFAAVRASWSRLLERALAEREPLTVGDALVRLEVRLR